MDIPFVLIVTLDFTNDPIHHLVEAVDHTLFGKGHLNKHHVDIDIVVGVELVVDDIELFAVIQLLPNRVESSTIDAIDNVVHGINGSAVTLAMRLRVTNQRLKFDEKLLSRCLVNDIG